MASKIFQVRYTVGDKTVANEHDTEKGAKADAKQLSKAIGNAMIGEIDIADDGTKSLVRSWEYTGGEGGKPIKREGTPPTEVDVLKTVTDTKLPEGKVEKKPKAPKLSDAEKLAKKKEEALAIVAAIDAGTYVAPVRGRKASGEKKKSAPKDEAEKVAKIVTDLKCSEKAAQLIIASGLNSVGRRARVALQIFDAEGSVLASAIVKALNESGKEDRVVEMSDVLGTVIHVNYLFTREEQPWKIVSQPKNEGDARLTLVPVKIEYEIPADDEPAVSEPAVPADPVVPDQAAE